PEVERLGGRRAEAMARGENCVTVRERGAASGEIVTALEEGEIERVLGEIQARGLKHVAVCLLFSFVNGEHERRIGRRLEAAGLTVSLSSELLAEFREYERASTVAINAALRPRVKGYLEALDAELERMEA